MARELEEQKDIEISILEFEEKMYPRTKMDWFTAYKYSQAMLAGNKFPPILVGLFGEDYIIIDGVHRVEAHKINKKTMINAIIRYYNDERSMYLDAVRLNATHGRPFSSQEKATIISRLEEYNYAKLEISELVGITEAKMISFVADRRAQNEQGENIVLKAPLKNLAGTTVSEMVEQSSNSFNVHNQMEILVEFHGILESGALEIGRKPIRQKVLEINKTFKDYIRSNRKILNKK